MVEYDMERADLMDGGSRELGADTTSFEYGIISEIVDNIMQRAGRLRADRNPNYYFDLIIHYEDIPELEHMYFEKWWKDNDT